MHLVDHDAAGSVRRHEGFQAFGMRQEFAVGPEVKEVLEERPWKGLPEKRRFAGATRTKKEKCALLAL